MERRDPFGPDNAIIVMVRLDQCADQSGYTNPVAAHMDGHIVALCILNHSVHRLGILGPEIENLANFNASRNAAAFLWDLIEHRLIMGFIGARIERCEFIQHALTGRAIIIVNFTTPKT